MCNRTTCILDLVALVHAIIVIQPNCAAIEEVDDQIAQPVDSVISNISNGMDLIVMRAGTCGPAIIRLVLAAVTIVFNSSRLQVEMEADQRTRAGGTTRLETRTMRTANYQYLSC